MYGQMQWDSMGLCLRIFQPKGCFLSFRHHGGVLFPSTLKDGGETNYCLMCDGWMRLVGSFPCCSAQFYFPFSSASAWPSWCFVIWGHPHSSSLFLAVLMLLPLSSSCCLTELHSTAPDTVKCLQSGVVTAWLLSAAHSWGEDPGCQPQPDAGFQDRP